MNIRSPQKNKAVFLNEKEKISSIDIKRIIEFYE